MRTIDLQEMQKIELDILLVFDELCKKHGLRYYMDGGTLLGAMCYEGFIPWDDDIDLKMPRPDYEKFLGLQDELPDHIYIDAPTEEHCEYTMTKLADNRTVLKEGLKETGVYIDIFPMDGHPEDEDECMEHLKALGRLNSLFHYSLDDFEKLRMNGLKGRLKAGVYAAKYSPWKLYRELTDLAMKYEYDSCEYVGLLVEGNAAKERFSKEWLEDGFCLEFEGHMIPAPSGYKKHLEIFYGEHITNPEYHHNLPVIMPDHNHEVYWKE